MIVEAELTRWSDDPEMILRFMLLAYARDKMHDVTLDVSSVCSDATRFELARLLGEGDRASVQVMCSINCRVLKAVRP